MTPSLFVTTGANDLASLLQTARGKDIYRTHLKQWITEEDFKWMANKSIELIRLPVGYWSLQAKDGYPSTKSRLDWAFAMAERYNMKILLDLHGVPGSQNGEQHSGKRGTVGWWDKLEDTGDILIKLAEHYAGSSALWGIELINEPRIDGNYKQLQIFYQSTYNNLCKILRPGTRIVFHDGFHPLRLSGAIKSKSAYPVMLDMHLYNLRSTSRHVGWYFFVRDWVYRFMIWYVSRKQPVIIGEWSGVLPQPIFNRHDSSQHPHLLRENISRQQQVYDRSFGHCYWNYKTENPGMWNFRSLVEKGSMRL